MSTPENIAAIVERDLADKNAVLAGRTALKVVVAGSGDEATTKDSIRLTRQWTRITNHLRLHYEAKLRESLYVTDPVADGETHSGRWRVLRVYTGPLKTNPQQQGVFQTLLYWPEDYGDFGEYCAESSPLFHEDATVFLDSPDRVSADHANTPGTIVSAVNRYDPETGLYSGELRENQSRPFPLDTMASGKTADDGSTNIDRGLGFRQAEIRAENQSAPPFRTAEELDAYLATHPNALVESDFNITRWGEFDWIVRRTDPILYPMDGAVFPPGGEVGDGGTAPASMYLVSEDEEQKTWMAFYLNVTESEMATIQTLVDSSPVAASNGAVTYEARPSLNRFGILDVTLVKKLVKSPLGALTNEMRWRIPGRAYVVTQTWSEDELTGETRVAFIARQNIELHYAKVVFGLAAAYSYIHQSDVAGGQPNHSGSGVSKMGDNLYFAHKVISTYDDSALDESFSSNFPTA